MNKLWIAAVSALALLNGCASVPQGSIPVVDSGVAVSNNERVSAQRTAGNYPQAAAPRAAQARTITEDSGVVVMIPGGAASVSTPISTQPFTPGPITPGPAAVAPIST
ncbi:MAG: hypothetical protein J6N20_20750, partial [Pseudomonas sp.]|nr:hypothetical protein [Pseudomonas sp.]